MIRAVRLCETPTIEIEHLGLTSSTGPPPPPKSASRKFRMLKSAVIRDFEQRYLADLMQQADGNVSRAARIAGKDRRDFGKLLKKYGLGGQTTRKAG